MQQDTGKIIEILTETLHFEKNFKSEELSGFNSEFREAVNDFMKEIGYMSREEMIEKLSLSGEDEIWEQISVIKQRLKEKSSGSRERIVEIFYNNSIKDQKLRFFLQTTMNKLRTGINNAENEFGKIKAEILYNFITLATLRI